MVRIPEFQLAMCSRPSSWLRVLWQPATTIYQIDWLLRFFVALVLYIPITGSHDARTATGATSFPPRAFVHEKIGGAHLPEHAASSFCGCSPRRLENNAARTPDITHMYVPEICAKPRARAHLVMWPRVFAKIPSGHPCANASTHNMRLSDNTGATMSHTDNKKDRRTRNGQADETTHN